MCICVFVYITCEVHDPRKYIANIERFCHKRWFSFNVKERMLKIKSGLDNTTFFMESAIKY